jgi:hypothetical protein
VVRKREAQNGSIKATPSMQLKQRGAYVRQENSNHHESIGSHWLVAAWPGQTMNAERTYPPEANLLASRDRRSRR